MPWVEVRTVLALAWMLLAPGGAVVSWTGVGQAWPWPSRLALAVSLSAVFYPLLLYLTPWIAWRPPLLWGALLAMSLLWGIRRRRSAAAHAGRGRPGRLLPRGWAGWLDLGMLGVLGLTLWTRGVLAHRYGFPAWTDSLHHTLLTHLTGIQGRLPDSLAPYFPVDLDMYHLGLYALAAPVTWLAQAPAHMALQWTAQTLNGLVGLGAYLVLERAFAAGPEDVPASSLFAAPAWLRQRFAAAGVHAPGERPPGDPEADSGLRGQYGRLAGLVGAVAVGLLSFQPAFYVNWGRYTQLAAQIVLPVAWWVSCQAVLQLSRGAQERRTGLLLLLGALLSAGVFLFHFRVAVFYALWLALGLGMGLLRLLYTSGFAWARMGRWLAACAGLALLTLLILSPVLGPALANYVASRAGVTAETVRDPAQAAAVRAAYFEFPWSVFFDLALHRWLAAVTGVAALVGLARRNLLVISAVLWMALLFALGHTYLLGISLLNVTNLGAVLILFYLPAGLILGAAAVEIVEWVAVWPRPHAAPGPGHRRASGSVASGSVASSSVAVGIVVVVLVGALAGARWRVQDIEPFRFFVTPQDQQALEWVRTHTPADALFAVNTVFWLPEVPHGTDAGYWLPYVAERDITAGVMLMELADPAYVERVVARSRAVQAVAANPTDPAALAALRELGVDYIYAGALGNYAGPSLDVERLAAQPRVELVYQEGAVGVLRLSTAQPSGE